MGGVVSAGVDNDDLVDKLKEADYIKTQNVEKIFRLVDRGCYMTKDSQSIAYRDNAWRNGNLHISAPCIYAQVMEGLQLGPGMSFLNLGSGTGYLSTMAGLIIGPTGINHGVELHGDVVEYARERLAWFLANTGSIDVSFFCEPQFSQGNALCIKDEERMLYDRVYCGASCPSSHENYMKNLIKVNGILVMPRNDKLLKIIRTGETNWNTESLLPVSFSSLIMPDNSLTAEEVELPPVNLISLQELSREAIRKLFRECIENEGDGLKNAFIYTIPPKPSPKSRKAPMSCLNGNHAKAAAMSDTENDTDDSEGRDGEWERLSSSQSLHESMHSAFIELARSFINRGTRETFDSNNDLVEEQEGEDDVEVEVEEEEEEDHHEEEIDYDEDNPFNETEGSHELFIGNGHDLIVRIIERVNRRPRSQTSSKNNNSSKETSTNQSKKDTESVDNPSTSKSTNDIKSDMNPECSNSESKKESETSEDKNEKFESFENNEKGEFIENKNEKSESFENKNEKSESFENKNEKEESVEDKKLKSESFNFDISDDEMKIDEDEGEEKTSEKATKNNDAVRSLKLETKQNEQIMEAESSQKSENPLKDFTDREFKKREKFDSGIVEDLDQAMSIDSSSSCSLKSRSNSESSLSDGSNKRTARNDGDSDSLDGGLGSSQPRSPFWKSRVKGSHRRKKRTIKYDNESKTDSSVPIEKYSQLMTNKIRQLPLPLPLKVYINYNRPL